MQKLQITCILTFEMLIFLCLTLVLVTMCVANFTTAKFPFPIVFSNS